MKNWHLPLLGLFAGVFLLSAIHLVSSPPRGASVILLPVPTPAPLTVHLSGAVNQPGVYTLPRESRLADVVAIAGGLRSDANTDVVNLAAPLKDGQKIHIPAVGEPVPPSAPAGEPSSSSPPSDSGAPVNINNASAEDLQTLPGIGPTRAEQIIAYREAHGGFKTIEEIQEVPGIGPATFEQMKAQITLD
jgi:competence protein ComEA